MNLEMPKPLERNAEKGFHSKSKKYRSLIGAGLVAISAGALDRSQVEIPAEELRSADTSMDASFDASQIGPEVMDDARAAKEKLGVAIEEAQSFHDISTLIMGSSVEIGGVQFVLDDTGEMVQSEDVVGSIYGVYESILDDVQDMQSKSDIDEMRLDKPSILESFSELTGPLAEKFHDLATYAYQFDHEDSLERNGDSFKSVEKMSVDEDTSYSVHTILPENSDAEPFQIVMPGYATTPESYKRLAIEMAFNGVPVSVIGIDELNPVVDGDGSQEYSHLPDLPEAYAVIADDMLDRLTERGEQKMNVTAYSTGAIGMTSAIEKNPGLVDDLTLVSPVGLDKDNYLPSLIDAGALGFNVLTKHSKQVKEAADTNQRTSEIHADTSAPKAQMKLEEYEGSAMDQNLTELDAGRQVISVELEGSVKNVIADGTDVQIITYDGDVFSEPGDVESEIGDLEVSSKVKEGFHSTIVYSPEQTAHEILGLQSQ